MSGAAQITILTKQPFINDPHGTLLSKRIALGSDGELVSDGTPCRMAVGTATTVTVKDTDDLIGVINAMRSCNALALGSVNGCMNGAPVRVVTVKMLSEQKTANTIARSREHLIFRPDEPAWMLLDFDLKCMPAEVRARFDMAGSFWELLLQVVPGLSRATRVMRASTSAGLLHAHTGRHFPGSGGLHVFVLVEDGADIPRALKALADRCWLHSLGWFWIGKAGQLLERGIIDASVGGSERLIFEGPPDIVPPLLQDKSIRACVPFDGIPIDTRTVIPDLASDEKQLVASHKEAQRQALEPQARRIRAVADQRLVEDLIARTGMPRTSALRMVQARHRGVLGPDIMLTSDHHGELGVGQILADPEHYIGETLCDPMEGPTYGYCKAQVMRSTREPGRVFIHSFAHGGATYDLKHNFLSARALLSAAPEVQLGDALCEVVAASELEDDELRQLLVLCAERAPKIGLRSFTRRLKDNRERREKARRLAAERARRAAGAIDQRLRRPLPPTDGEVTPVVMELDRVLGSDDSEHPPMRRGNGLMVEVRMEVPFELHQLTSETANADENANLIPAPPELLLQTMTPATVNMLIERFFIWEKTDTDGNFLYNGHLGEPFIQALMQLAPATSCLPHIRSVVTAPLILADGDVLDGVGLDRQRGLYYAIEPALRDCLPPQGEVTADAVREAMRFLLDEWQVDVLTNIKGKLVSIAMGLSILERHLLDQRPAFLITAGQRGGGKTTLIHMVVVAVLGRMASATAWSTIPEERRKALFAFLLQGIAALVWDNLPTGTVISCSHIEESLTSPTYSDRILGVTRRGTAQATAIQMFSLNNGDFGGDMASRGLKIRLKTDDPHPENRSVLHEDPVGWTMVNRARILRAFYTILVYGCRNRPDDQKAKSRFKTWWKLVGYPVELAASLLDQPVTLDFAELFKETEENDPVVTGIVTAMQRLREQFGDVLRGATKIPDEVCFMPRNIRGLLDKGEQARDQKRSKGLFDRANALANDEAITTADAFLEMIEGLAGKRHKSPSTDAIGRLLNKIVERAVDLDDTTVAILRKRLKDGTARYHVETYKSRVGYVQP